MATTDLATRIEEILAPIAERNGFELVAVEQAGGRHTPVIRVLLDREGGLNLDAVCAANSWVNEALEEADPVSGPYTLEVSSPGIDRPLRKLEDFTRFAGETVTVKSRPEGEATRSITGTLIGVDGTTVIVEVEGEHTKIEHESIIKARIKGVVDFNTERGAC